MAHAQVCLIASKARHCIRLLYHVHAVGAINSQAAAKQSCKRAKIGVNPKTGKRTGPKSSTATKAGGTEKKGKVKH